MLIIRVILNENLEDYLHHDCEAHQEELERKKEGFDANFGGFGGVALDLGFHVPRWTISGKIFEFLFGRKIINFRLWCLF